VNVNVNGNVVVSASIENFSHRPGVVS